MWLRRFAAELESSALTPALFAAWGEFHRAVLDHYWDRRGFDDWGRFELSLAQIGVAAARTLLDGPNACVDLARSIRSASTLLKGELPDAVILKAVDANRAGRPRMWAEYGRFWRDSVGHSRLCVVGLRGDGEGLAAAVAAGSGTEIMPVTVRVDLKTPQLNLSPACAAYLLKQKRRVKFALVPDGQVSAERGFAVIQNWLTAQGLDGARVHVLDPSARAAH